MAMATSEYAWTFYIQGSQNFMMFVNCLQLQWKAGNHNICLFCEYFRPQGRIKHWQSKFLRTASASAVLLMTLNKFGLIVKPSTSDITYRFHQGKRSFLVSIHGLLFFQVPMSWYSLCTSTMRVWQQTFQSDLKEEEMQKYMIRKIQLVEASQELMKRHLK